MKGWTLLLFVIAAALIVMREWPRIGREQAKDRAMFMALVTLGLLLAVFLWCFPDTPGPTDLVDMMFRPLADWLGL